MARELAEDAADAIDALFEIAHTERTLSANEAREFLQIADRLREESEYEMPEVGDVVRDTVTREHWQTERVVVEEIPGTIAAHHTICFEDSSMGRKWSTVAKENVNEPRDAPVVIGHYEGGTGKKYAFPVTRLDF